MGAVRRVLVALCAAALVALAAAGPASAKTVWLCKPGLANNPCTPNLRTTVLSPTETRLATVGFQRARRPRYDCFYVYPTVSSQPGLQADKSIDPELRSIALYQAARYSAGCRVYAPVYRQLTLSGIRNPATTDADRERAYSDVREAWRTYLRRHNHGRGVVLIGHSQGTYMLRELVKREIDPVRRARRRLISAVLLGGNVTVARGRDRGGDFRNVRACRSAGQVGCVVAFSAFNEPVPAETIFGRAESDRLEVLCTNPAALEGGVGQARAGGPHRALRPGRDRRAHRADRWGTAARRAHALDLRAGRHPRALLPGRRRQRAPGDPRARRAPLSTGARRQLGAPPDRRQHRPGNTHAAGGPAGARVAEPSSALTAQRAHSRASPPSPNGSGARAIARSADSGKCRSTAASSRASCSAS